jgi:HNH endonuclease
MPEFTVELPAVATPEQRTALEAVGAFWEGNTAREGEPGRSRFVVWAADKAEGASARVCQNHTLRVYALLDSGDTQPLQISPVHEPRPSPSGVRREGIPRHVRDEVWRRDQGRCSACGSRQRLEFDHIVPVSRGGSNTARNIELLCESCNRRKGAAIG